MSIYEDELEGREFDWYAIDASGNIAIFCTAGEGCIPDDVISCFEKHDEISDSIESPNWGSSDVWSDYSALGLYVFDWDLHGGPYKRKRLPSAEISIELKERIMKVVKTVKVGMCFSQVEDIDRV
jgi:hypothetical protein